MTTTGLFDSFPLLTTNRLCLRQMNTEDAEDLYLFYSDSKVTQYLDWHGPASVQDSRDLIHSWNQYFQDKRLFPWGISMKTDPTLIGTVMFMPIRDTFEKKPLLPLNVGFELNRHYWNKGIMSEALEAVLAFSREHIGAHRIQAEVFPENKASLKVLEKLGFKQEGLMHQYLMHEVTRTFLDVIMLAFINNT
ncbi:GNAT family N-acetyltransferase [Paenibacillus sp. LMG 31458]|uniref:GNAT family N-acetyltransferase n=1 Tax=Paenibacillus phytorum TaxID=2654977 RepID=A0ABX1Y602_9BACL|nr:GNAT family N-acetyltransferase [Paenibacillus phytorum]NOU75666.1 GNAT family N-acetyltransferase [Paenibacillus phytorum]